MKLARRRWLWIALGGVLLLWLVPAVFVAVYDPTVAHELPCRDKRLAHVGHAELGACTHRAVVDG